MTDVPDCRDFLLLHRAILREAPFKVIRTIVNIDPRTCSKLAYRQDHGLLPLHMIVGSRRRASSKAVRCISEAFPLATRQQESRHGNTPLHLAVKYRQGSRVVEALLHAESEVEGQSTTAAAATRSTRGRLPIHVLLTPSKKSGIIDPLSHPERQTLALLINAFPQSLQKFSKRGHLVRAHGPS